MDDTAFKWKAEGLTESVTKTGWLQDETLQSVSPYTGHFLALVNGEQIVPHAPAEDVELPKCKMKPPKWPLPSELVTNKEFQRDEWAYDPAVNGRILTADLERDAVRCANHLIAGHSNAFLVSTSKRLAVVIEQQDVDGDSAMTRFAGMFGKDKEAKEARKELVTWWEVDRSRLRAVNAVTYGRNLSDLRRFTAFVFADGSVLEMRAPH
ncbi:hypothetical protein [Kibdelosporangium aridum]|nr:hypothetical protein [Kibdelosporangium aridum]